MGDVIELGKKRDNTEPTVKAESTDTDLEAIAKRNAANAKRMKEDRERANKGVIRSYRLKH